MSSWMCQAHPYHQPQQYWNLTPQALYHCSPCPVLQHGTGRPRFYQAASPEPSTKIKVWLLVHKVELCTDFG